MNKDEINLLMKKYAKGVSSKYEIKLIETYFDQLQRSGEIESIDLEDDELLKRKIYQKILSETDIQKSFIKNTKGKSFVIHSFVYLILVCISVAIVFQMVPKDENSYIIKSTGKGQKLNMSLPDGSVVYLNAESSIRFPKSFGKESRSIQLEGEAFFDVVKLENMPFTIDAKDLKTIVLGTSFNIKSYVESPFELTVMRGKVAVTSQDKFLVESLEKNQQIIYDPASHEIINRVVAGDDYILWKNNIIKLNDVNLTELITLLERWYDVKIELDDAMINDCRISGKYKSDHIENILEGIKYISDIEYEIVNKKEIKMKGSLCNKLKN
ncbi:MAG: FecR family protein [Cyclobacteriaceae bacterium]